MADQVTVTIDNREIAVPPGTLIVDAAAALNIEIPIFCSHPKLDPVACCRMCLVEVEGPRGVQLLTACSVPVAPGMIVRTDTERVKSTQEANLAFLLLNHPLDCPICDKGGECPLQDQTMRFGPGVSELVEAKRLKNKHYLISDTIVLDQERCVVCWRCIRYLKEWEDKPQLELFERGGETIIDIQPGHPVDAKTGGNIIDICPVGALTNRVSRFAYRPWEIERTPSICNHCSVGCNLRLDTRTHKLRRIIGRENSLVNDQWICDKGRFAHGWVNDEARLKMPLLRKDGELTPVTWHEALQFVADRLKQIVQEAGPNSVGGIGSAKLSNESNYLMQRFMRQVIGANNIDHRDGAEIAALPTGLPALSHIMKPQYGPDPEYDCVMLFGIDPSEELPILDLHLKRAITRAGVQLIIAHPRKIELTRYGGPYLGYRPGTEPALLNALTEAALAAGDQSKPRVEQMVAGTTDEQLRELCGVDPEEVQRAARMLDARRRTLIIYGPMAARGEQGISVLNGLTNLATVTGNYEHLAYVGLDANSQGCRDMGVFPDRLPGHAGLDHEDTRRRLRDLWDKEPPTEAGMTYRQMLDGAGSAIKALLIMGADPASERGTWAQNLQELDLLVVHELFLTKTAQRADVVLPAVSWAETDGTFTNLERRVQRSRRALTDPQTKAAPDWMILDHLATRMGTNWPYADAQSVTQEITRAIPFYVGLTWEALGDQGIQWDAAAVRSRPSYRKVTQPELAEGQRAFSLVTGTVVYDGGNLFYATEQTRNMAFGLAAGISPADADRLGIADGTTVAISSEWGELILSARISDQVRPGTIWIPESLRGAPAGDLIHDQCCVTVDIRVVDQTEPEDQETELQVG